MRNSTVTLIASDRLEERQASWWRRVAEHWPAGSPAPKLQLLGYDAAIDDPGAIIGSVVVAFFEDDDDAHRSPLQLSEALHDRALPGVFLFREIDERRALLASEVVMVAPIDTPANEAAWAIAALGQRQSIVESMLHELRTTRRFQSGMRGEMDRVHEELQLAAQVQRDFLPKCLPSVPGVDFGVLFRPCGYVSGDIYDVTRLDEHHVGFFIADAIGHGVPAALMTMVICRGLPMKEIIGDEYRIVPPAEALTRLNVQLIKRQGESPRFASAVYGVIDVRTREVTLAGAGHPPPLRFRAGGMERVETEGGLLGVFAKESYQQVRFVMDMDETLVLHSDGFETAFPDVGADNYGRRMPTTHYLRHFSDMASRVRTGTEIARSFVDLARNLDTQTGSLHQVDDVTAIGVTPRPARAGDELLRPNVRTVTAG